MRRGTQGADLLDWGVSMMRMTCAASLAAASQVAEALSGRHRRAERDLDAIRHTAQEGLTGSGRDLFRLGEQVERGMVETASRFAADAREACDPTRLAARSREVLGRAFTRRRAQPCRAAEHDGNGDHWRAAGDD